MMSSATNLSFQIYEGMSGLERLAAEWTVLLRAMPDARFNHFPGWYRAYLKSLARDANRVWFIAARRNGELAGVLPIQFLELRAGAFRARVVGTIEDDEMQSSDFIFPKCEKNADLLYDLTRWLRTQRTTRWSELRLRKVPDDSCIAYAARRRLPWATLTRQHDRSAYFRTDDSYERATQAMSAKFRSNLRRRNRLAQQSAPLRLQRCRQSDELPAAFETFLSIEASGTKGEAGTSSAIRCQPALLAFYRALMQEFGASDACVINLLWHGDRPVAGQFCLQIGKTLNILKVGFDKTHAKFAPGLLLLETMIQQACQDPGIDILHLVNDPAWTRFFRPLSHEVRSYCAPAWSTRGMVVHIGLWAKRLCNDIAVSDAGATSVASEALAGERQAGGSWET